MRQKIIEKNETHDLGTFEHVRIVLKTVSKHKYSFFFFFLIRIAIVKKKK